MLTDKDNVVHTPGTKEIVKEGGKSMKKRPVNAFERQRSAFNLT